MTTGNSKTTKPSLQENAMLNSLRNKTLSFTMPENTAPVTQMVILPIPAGAMLDLSSSTAGKAWQSSLEILKQSPGYQRLYWGRQVETPGNVQLHIVRETLQHHRDFVASSAYSVWMQHLNPLLSGPLTIRHATISEFSPGCASLGKGAPVTGTAIYLSTTADFDVAWSEWVPIVQNIPGFMGIAGGPVIDAVDGHETAFIALVGWESVAAHEGYHHTKHFRDRSGILLRGNKGYGYYGHIAFRDSEAGFTNRMKL